MLMWRVTGGRNTVYVMGSVHMGRADMYPLPVPVEEGFAASEILAVEADVEGPCMADFRNRVAALGLYPEEDRLRDHLQEDTLRLLEKMDDSAFGIDRMRPWLAAATIQSSMLKRLGFDEDGGLDRHFLRQARGVKEIVEVEGLEGQLRVIERLSPEEQDRMLFQTLRQLDRFEDFVEPLIDAWRTGDESAFYDIFCQGYLSDRTFGPLMEKLIFQRNEHMLTCIDSYLETGRDHFVLVGAGHLAGPKGVIARLKEKRHEAFQI